MNIVLEGPDNAGKTTLAEALAGYLGFTIKSPQGPCKTSEEVEERCKDYFSNYPNHTIFDRHPVISQPIYRHLHNTPDVPSHWVQWLYNQKPLIIYCRPPKGRTADDHKGKAHDTAEELQRIKNNFGLLMQLYDGWAVERAHMIYRIGDDTSDFCRRVARQLRPRFDPIGDIRAFHERFKLDYEGKARRLPPMMQNFRIKFLKEELNEYELAVDELAVTKDPEKITELLAKSLDALIDLTYVALGTSYLHGFNFTEGWQRVHLANMMKRRVERPDDSKRGSVYDVIKPDGWEPPDHTDIVGDHDHR